MIQANNQRQPVEVLCEEFLVRWRKGDDVSIESYAEVHENLRDDILALFPAMLAMETAKQDDLSASTRPVYLHVDQLQRIGDFRIIREIGRGGMAIVYEAEQQSLQRRVAIKVFPEQAFENSRHVHRFQREAQTVAALHHNNIVPIFGSGEQDGLHYFVMQLLTGQSLDKIIETLNLCEQQGDDGHCSPSRGTKSSGEVPVGSPPASTRENARSAFHLDAGHWRWSADIVQQIANGLEYAHQHGVMHRDIKASNIIVDEKGRAWLTDFGLATNQSADQLSHSGDIAGTLRYMAPERLSGESDIRSDVYSLGLTLYEILTLRHAFNCKGRGQLINTILHESPRPPREIVPEIPRDLETIVLKAMAKDPRTRYASAADFAMDLQNFAADRPINARRVNRAERIVKWAKRNPIMAALTSALIVCVVASFITISSNLRRAEAEGARAERNLILALDSMDRFLEKFEADWMAHPVAPETEDNHPQNSVRFVASDESADILEDALHFYQQFWKENAQNPKLNFERAKAYRKAGEIRERLGQYELAEASYRNSVNILAENDPANIDFEQAASIADARNRLAMVLHARDQHEQAMQELMRANSVLKAPLATNDSLECRYQLAIVNSNMGTVAWWLRDSRQSTQKHRKSIMLLEELVADEPQISRYRLSLAHAYRSFFRSALSGEDRNYAKQLRKSAVAILEELVEDFPDVPDYCCELSELLTMNAATPITVRSQPPLKRVTQLTRSEGLAEQLVNQYPFIPRYKAAFARALSEKATLLEASDLDQACLHHAKAIRLYDELCATYPKTVHYFVFSAKALKKQAQCFIKRSSFAEAKEAFTKAIARQQSYLDQRAGSYFAKRGLSEYHRRLADVEVLMGNTIDAELLLNKSQQIQTHSTRSSRDQDPRPGATREENEELDETHK